MLQIPTGKQGQYLVTPSKRINILYGSWRSGKTMAQVLKMLWETLEHPDGNVLLVGNTISSIERNIVSEIKKLLPDYVNFKRQAKVLTIFNREIWCEGADKLDSYKRIEGESLWRVYVDEWLHVPENFTMTALSRLSDPGAAIIGTLNPGPPSHYLYRRFVSKVHDRNGEPAAAAAGECGAPLLPGVDEGPDDIAAWRFTLSDNPHLDQSYKEAIVRENPPGTLFYDRNIMGLWRSASGLAISNFARDKHISSPPVGSVPVEVRVGVDYGTKNPTYFVQMERYRDGTWYASREYYWDSSVTGRQKTDVEYSRDMAAWLSHTYTPPAEMRTPWPGAEPPAGGEEVRYYPSTIEVDPSAASFILQLLNDGMYQAHPADNQVVYGIRHIASMLETGKLKLTWNVPWLIHCIENYEWDESSTDDQVVKEDDHPIDGLRYVVNSIV